eukprot:1752109-Pleurochrysis_carterae.AAC.4
MAPENYSGHKASNADAKKKVMASVSDTFTKQYAQTNIRKGTDNLSSPVYVPIIDKYVRAAVVSHYHAADANQELSTPRIANRQEHVPFLTEDITHRVIEFILRYIALDDSLEAESPLFARLYHIMKSYESLMTDMVVSSRNTLSRNRTTA